MEVLPMLVLSRKTQESVVVGGSVGFERLLKVTVLDIGAGNVRLGFEIDKSVPVHRWELWERIHANGALQTARPPPVAESNGNSLVRVREHDRPLASAKAAGATLQKYGILVVDDEPSVLVVVSTALRKQGFTVWQAANGQEALKVCRRHGVRIDVVLLDVHMPGLDGPQTMAALHAIHPKVPCFFMSGDLESGAEKRLHSLGGTAFFRKPFRPAEVAQMLWHLASHGDRKSCSL
jgi:carbon storage regulator CsrA